MEGRAWRVADEIDVSGLGSHGDDEQARSRLRQEMRRVARERGLGWRFAASLDQVLTLVELNKEHHVLVSERLTSWREFNFYLHRIASYVLGSFVVAGLAGLTQGN
jgi:hypothetical protein